MHKFHVVTNTRQGLVCLAHLQFHTTSDWLLSSFHFIFHKKRVVASRRSCTLAAKQSPFKRMTLIDEQLPLNGRLLRGRTPSSQHLHLNVKRSASHLRLALRCKPQAQVSAGVTSPVFLCIIALSSKGTLIEPIAPFENAGSA